MAEVILCLAGTQAESEYARRQAGRPPREWRYLSSPDRIKGHFGATFVCVGTWAERPDVDDLIYELRIANAVEVVLREVAR